MGSGDFDLHIGVDWSGALPAQGVALAECDNGGRVTLVPPPERRWTRAAAARHVLARLGDRRRVLAGFDFAFGLPWIEGVGHLDGRVPGLEGMPAVWRLVDDASGRGDDFFAGAAVHDPRLAPSFWIDGKTPAHWGDGSTKRRRTEIVAAASGAGTPVSVFKLAAAAKQVGKASLAGMRMLTWLTEQAGERAAVWPAEPIADRSVLCEIYPTLFRLKALGHNRKIRERAELAAAVQRLGGHLSDDVPDTFDDHAGDAMVSAAGLRALAREPSAWAPVGLDPDTARREGWIFGVGA